MVNSWPAIVMGWPAIVASLVLLGLGIATRRRLITLVGALVALPFLLYLFGTPRFQYWAPVLALLNFAAAASVGRGYRWLPAGLVVPFLGTVVWLAHAVLSQ